MPFAYSAEYRSMVLEQTRAGAKAANQARHLEVSEATIDRWIAQDKIDQGERPGNTTTDNAELRAARRRIAELETELAATKRASELFAEDRVVRPKDLFPIVAQLAAEGHSSKRICRLLRVAPSGFFARRSKSPSPRQIRRAWLTDLILQIWNVSRQTYGARRVRAELADAHAQPVNLKLVRSIMRKQAIVGLPARRRQKRSDSNRYTSSDLVNRSFELAPLSSHTTDQNTSRQTDRSEVNPKATGPKLSPPASALNATTTAATPTQVSIRPKCRARQSRRCGVSGFRSTARRR